jgi:hypothetical protein
MKSLSKWFSAAAALVLLSGTAMAADAIATGKIKSVLADKKEFVLTDAAGKDWTFEYGENVLINRGGKESKTDLNAGDPVSVLYDKGLVNWTANYILVQAGDSKNCVLAHGKFKAYNADKKEYSLTDDSGKDVTFTMNDAKVRLNKEPSKIEDIKVGDKVLIVAEKDGDKTTVKSVMVEHK